MIAVINPDAGEEIRRNLKKLGLEPVPVPRCGRVAEPLAGHPDLQVFVHGTTMFCHRDMDPAFIRRCVQHCDVIVCATRLGPRYPEDIPLNIACTGEYAFMFSPFAEPAVVKHLSSHGIETVNVNQGYAKCSTCIVDENSIITADPSIARVGESLGMNILRIRPGYISLPGYDYGFIGGASCRFRDHVLFTGELSRHPDRERITGFIEGAGLRAGYLSREEAIDLGSIFII